MRSSSLAMSQDGVKNRGRIPFDKLPRFKEGNQAPTDFLEDLQRCLTAYEISEDRYLTAFPMCLDIDTNCRLTRWIDQAKTEQGEITWETVTRAFCTRFEHHHKGAILKDKWRALRMAPNAAGKYCDTFLQLTNQLRMEPADEQVIYQFKLGLTESLKRQVGSVLAPRLLDGTDKAISVLDLTRLVVGIEAENKLSAAPTTTPIGDKKQKEQAFCTNCNRKGHATADCRSAPKTGPRPTTATDHDVQRQAAPERDGSRPAMKPPRASLSGKELEQYKTDQTANACFKCHKTGH
jgi:hypothetical protein